MTPAASRSPGLVAGFGTLCALVAIVFWPGLDGGFLFDDYHVIVDNETLALPDFGATALADAAFSTHTGPTRRPLALLSFALERTLLGLDPFLAKSINLALHAFNALLLLLLARRLLPRVGLAADAVAPLAWLAAALWAVHPLNLAPVLYVVQRMTLLASTFMLLGLLVYAIARGRQLAGLPAPRWAWPAFLACLLAGLLSKETAVVMLLMVAAVELHAFRRAGIERAARVAAIVAVPLIAGAVAAALIAPAALGLDYGSRGFTLGERLLTEARVLWHYLGMLAWPQPSSFALFHDDVELSRGLFAPPTTLPALVGVAALAVLAITGRPRWLAFGAAWFLAGHALESSVLPLELMHEHRNYLASFGPILAVLLAVRALLARLAAGRFALPLAAVALVACAGLTALRAERWSDPLAMMAFEVRAHAHSARSQYELGRLLVEHARASNDAGAYARGIAALERAASLAPYPALALGTLLQLAVGSGDEARVTALLETIAGQPPRLRAEVFRQLVRCQVALGCAAAPAPLFALADGLLDGTPLAPYWRRETIAWLAIYYLRVLGDGEAGIRLLRELAAEPGASLDYRVRLAEALAAYGERGAARARLAEIRAALPWHAWFSQRPELRRLRALDAKLVEAS